LRDAGYICDVTYTCPVPYFSLSYWQTSAPTNVRRYAENLLLYEPCVINIQPTLFLRSKVKHQSPRHQTRNSTLRASSPARRNVPTAIPFVPIGVAAVFALFAAAVARRRLAPLVRFTRVIIIEPPPPVTVALTPPPPPSRSTRRRNGLGKFSSSSMLYTGAAGVTPHASPELIVCVLLEEREEFEDEDDDDDVKDEQVVVIVRSSSCPAVSAAAASTRLPFDRDDTDGRRRREGAAGAARVGTGATAAL